MRETYFFLCLSYFPRADPVLPAGSMELSSQPIGRTQQTTECRRRVRHREQQHKANALGITHL